MKIKIKIILPHIYLITYPSQYELCMSFVRMQEFYESPKFRGKYFTLEDYMDHWSKTKGNGSFTYPATWNGFNVPGDVIKNWMEVCNDNDDKMRDREHDLLYYINKLMLKEGLQGVHSDDLDKIYVIGAHGKSFNIKDIVGHESAHAFYRVYPEYKESCDKILNKINPEEMNKMRNSLLALGYNRDVVLDEVQAYSSVDSGMLYNSLKKEFKSNFENFKKNLVKKS